MKINLNNLFYSKCPYCHKHGIPAIKLRQGIVIQEKCKYCHKEISVHSIATIFVYTIVILVLIYLKNKFLNDILGIQIPDVMLYISGLILAYLAEYFAFYEPVNNDEYDKTDMQVAEILTCFNKKDKDALKKLFCKKTLKYYDIDSEIDNAFSLYSGESKDYYIDYSGAMGIHIPIGSWENKCSKPSVRNIITNENEIYTIDYGEYIICKESLDAVGIGKLVLRNDNSNEKVQVGGYDWK